ncbi:GNAT family N-acetyltransferase [uncultured Clostridium sp.]|uniref:GNAT family N-acetyltransferase n=1 Tax=uncultured Clostridium sp. TaxID=59620 RepID=UPI00262F5C34|nr:GNAT family N-acetyltransferase [uncultured Clostridium sp.]
MIKFEKLKIKNIAHAKKLINKCHYAQKENIIIKYAAGTFLEKYTLRRTIYLIKYNNIYIGIVWIKKINKNELEIIDIHVESQYLEKIDLKKVKEKLVVYEGINNQTLLDIMEKNSFIQIQNVKLLKKDIVLDENINQDLCETNINFKPFLQNRDEELRCSLQNEIFHNEDRVPLEESDIFFDEQQSYYIDELSIFIYYNNLSVGYAQIIKKKGRFFLVNFGILKEFRKLGLGEKFLAHMCNLAYKYEIKELYINVDENNLSAINLYMKAGFIYVNNKYAWIKESL